MVEPTQQNQQRQEQKEAGFSFFNTSEWPQFAWNWLSSALGLLRYRVGKVAIGTRKHPIWKYLNDKGWFAKNETWFGTKLQTVEDFWGYQGTHYGQGKGEDGEPTLLGNKDGIVSMYEKLGAYSDIDRLKIEQEWFEVGTGYTEENIEHQIPDDPDFWNIYNWEGDKVREVLANPNIMRGLNILKRIKLESGMVFHEGKKEYREDLYCFGYTNAEALAKRINTYNDQLNVIGMQHFGTAADVRNRTTEATRALVELVNLIAEKENETHEELKKLIGLSKTYHEKWEYQVTKASPEGKKVGVIRYPHTYRIIKQLHYLGRDDTTGEFEIVEKINIRGRTVRDVDEEGNLGEILTQHSFPRLVIMKLKQDRNIYEEEEEELNEKIEKVREEIEDVERIIGGGARRDVKEEYLAKLEGLKDRLQRYAQRLEDIRHNIDEDNKAGIIEKTTPKISPNEFWKRPEELDYGLDENGYPLEIDPVTGEVLIDRWWNEIAQNEWQLRTIALKPGGLDYLKKHLDGFQGTITGDIGKPEITITNIGSRRIRKIKDDRFHGYVDLLELGAIIYSSWDAFRDDLRDGRYHPHCKSIGDYVIEGEGGFDEARAAPYPRAWLQTPGGAGRGIGAYYKRRGVIPTKPIGISMNVHERDALIKATPYHFMDKDEVAREFKGIIPSWVKGYRSIPDDEKAVSRGYKMRLPDGSFEIGKRKPSKYDPAFDRRALNLDFVCWGRMYYYRWSGDINEWDENPFPHISTRGIALYFDYMVKSHVWNYEDAKKSLQGLKLDYGVRGSTKYGFVNPASGEGVVGQEN